MQPAITLENAQKLILRYALLKPPETVGLDDALGRVPAASLKALVAQPSYDQSGYDGYVIPQELPSEEDGDLKYRLAGEIAAGDSREKKLRPGTTLRIMTGGAIPGGGWKVIPQEFCRERSGIVRIAPNQVADLPSHIQRSGSELALGNVVVSAGERLLAEHLAGLASGGYRTVQVYSRPKVSFFCTGSELVDHQQEQHKGQKVSSNRYLIEGLVRSSGGIADAHGSVADTMTETGALLETIHSSSTPDIIISTGGMGPGKYDLVQETFSRAGGESLFTALALRPGRSTLFGMLGKSLYFGLPGPPPAVRALFHVLVRPAILRMQGVKRSGIQSVQAYLQDDMSVRKKGVLKLQEGIITLVKGKCVVRPVCGREVPNSYLLCPAHRKRLRKMELVRVYPLQPPFVQP